MSPLLTSWLALGICAGLMAAVGGLANMPPPPRPVTTTIMFLVLGLLMQLVSFVYLSALIFSGTRISAAFGRRRRLSAGATSAAGALFLGFAVKLSLSTA